MSIEVLGREELVQNFSKYHANVVDRIVIHTEIVQGKVVNFAKANHPYVDRTQNLSNSIQPGQIIVKDGSVEAEVAARMQYASFIEFGTSRARPFPFLYPALAANMGEFRQRMTLAVRDARP